ncbi:MAG: O-methyltransferase [Muribaculaceae bacterium]
MTDIDSYIAEHIDAEPPRLHELYRRTHLTRLYPRMCCGHVQGRILKMLTTMIRPMHILELGTFSGYSALCLAEGMPQGAVLHTIEIDDEAEDAIRQALETSPRAADITLHIGDALDIVPQLPLQWDMALIDANKRHYADYYHMLRPRMAPGAYIIADNTLWDGKVTDPEASDPQTRGIRDFNDLIAADTSVEKVMLPLRDGLTIIRCLPL